MNSFFFSSKIIKKAIKETKSHVAEFQTKVHLEFESKVWQRSKMVRLSNLSLVTRRVNDVEEDGIHTALQTSSTSKHWGQNVRKS